MLWLPLNIAIIGGGIAGCAAAIALQNKGYACTVYEKRAEFKHEGYGIQLSPNALHSLKLLAVNVAGFEPKKLIVQLNIKMDMTGFMTLKREVLHHALREAVHDLRLNSPIDHMNADVVIEASGVNSQYRQDPVVETGLTAWRGVSAGKMQNVEMTLLSGGHNVQYPVNDHEINTVFIRKNGVILDGLTPYPLFTRPFKGGEGHVTLVGDAAHAMLPSLAQGAAMALEDAVVLAEVFDPSNIAPSLRAFEAARKPRVMRVARAALLNSHIYKLPKPFSFARDLVIKTLSEQQFRAQYNWIYDIRP